MGDGTLRRRFAERAIEARDRFSADRVSGLWEQLLSDAHGNK